MEEKYEVENKEVIKAEVVDEKPIKKKWYKDPMNIITIVIAIAFLIWILIINL